MNERNERNQEQETVWASIPIGAGAGVALGVVLMNVLNQPGFFAVGISLGLCMGVAVGVALSRR